MKSKTLATWIAVVGGSLGLHRFYLHGFRDKWGWLHPLPALLGLYGIQRVREYGLDDQLSWALIPLLGVVVAVGMLMAIVYGLTSDSKWDARFNPQGPVSHTGWGAVMGVIVALMLGAGVLMATIAFSGQRYFEYQVEQAHRISQ
ncbi:MAG TPA: hypothetical protein VJ743_17025 [Albitalea sp.]|nr:hypothetical protein [Albitalea sp.]